MKKYFFFLPLLLLFLIVSLFFPGQKSYADVTQLTVHNDYQVYYTGKYRLGTVEFTPTAVYGNNLQCLLLDGTNMVLQTGTIDSGTRCTFDSVHDLMTNATPVYIQIADVDENNNQTIVAQSNNFIFPTMNCTPNMSGVTDIYSNQVSVSKSSSYICAENYTNGQIPDSDYFSYTTEQGEQHQGTNIYNGDTEYSFATDNSHGNILYNVSLVFVCGDSPCGSLVFYDNPQGFEIVPTHQLTSLSPAKIWIGLKNSDDVGVKFDVKAEVYKDSTLVTSGETDSVLAGSSGFNNAKLDTISFNSFSPLDFPSGSQLKMAIYVRNACTGSGHNSGTARLWYNDSQANSQFGATIGNTTTNYFLGDALTLLTSAGTGPKKTIDIQSGAKCSAFKPFGTWSITL
ncbi:MAG TPA: hypothetical protein VLG12_06895 [Candidatus Saccharimonadales bacterium]|nr:hypothetical protein [Candidatus Saccharimonadales bacterium]